MLHYVHGKERKIAANDEQHDENAKKVVARLDENVEMVIVLEMKRVSAVEDDGCA